jgi:4-amino-4-deoxy-L-arabinose transferase-like glycosyltransferase
MAASTFFARALQPAERLTAALRDPARRERTVVLVLIAYALLWTLYGAFAKGSQDIHFDMGEVVAWARELDWGYAKHPPLAAWLAWVWFAVFPPMDWSYYLFAMALTSLALWFAWRVASDHLDSDKRIVALALLTFVPFFNFHALKFNVNTVMIPAWAAATFCFLRSFESRSLLWAALAGVAAAAAMLAKYWSVLLLIGLAAAALTDPRRKDYFRSGAPWVTVLAGLIALAPHLVWLVRTDFASFGYATGSHPVENLWQAARSGLGYVGGALGYAAAPIVFAITLTRPSVVAVRDTLWPQDGKRRALLAAFAVPLLLPAVAAVAARSEIVSIWAMASMTLLPVVLLASPLLAVPPPAVAHVAGLAVAFPAVMVLASPLIGVIIHERGVPKGSDHYQLLAAETDKAWREATGRPLRFIGGDPVLAFGTVFYLADRPSAFTEFDDRAKSPIDPARVLRDGVAMLCVANDRGCIDMIKPREAKSAAVQRREVEVVRRHWGVPGDAGRYLIVVVPPR